jgi:hypothetical protein
MMESYSIPKPNPWLFQQAILLCIMLAIDGFRTTKMRPNSSRLSLHIPDDLFGLSKLAALHFKLP